MALKVTVAAPSSKKLTVGVNYGMQGSNYNPQPAASGTVVQNPNYNPQKTAPAKVLQNPAPAKKIQPAFSAAEVQAAAEKQRQVLKQQFQVKVDTSVATKMQPLKVAAAKVKDRLTFQRGTPKVNIKLPERSEYHIEYAKAYNEAIAEFDRQRQSDKKGFSKFWDKVTFGQDTRDRNARDYAAKRAKEIMEKDFPAYEGRINDYIKKQASAQERINQAAQTAKSQAEFDSLVASEQAALDTEFSTLQKMAARYEGQGAAFDSSSQKALTSFTAKTLSKGKKLISDENPVWRYTLGSGTRNIPSIVTAPSRVINWAGNLNTKDREIYQYGGGFKKRTESGDNAWQAGFNQRNFNIRPWVDRPYNEDAKRQLLETAKNSPNASLNKWRKAKEKGTGFRDIKGRDLTKMSEDEFLRYLWDEKNNGHKVLNTAQELAADPLNLLLGAGAVVKGAKGTSFVSKLDDIGRTSKLTSGAFKLADKANEFRTAFKTALGENRVMQWLNKTHVTPGQELIDAKIAARTESRELQEQLLKKMGRLSGEKSKHIDYDISIFDDLNNLTESELRMLQRMTDGKLAFRDRAMLVGRNNAPIRAKLADIAERYTKFTENMKLADDVSDATRFGRGKKLYSPRTNWVDNLDEYDFRLFKKKAGIQGGEDFKHGVVDRYFKSNLEEVMTEGGKKNRQLTRRINQAKKEYGESFKVAKSKVEAAQHRYNRRSTRVFRYLRNRNNVRADLTPARAVANSAANIVTTPTRLWKKAVLKYRPAWYVNNAVYNTQAATLAGGSGAILEQIKMLNPRYWRKAMDELPASVRSNVANEIGGGRLSKFASGVENWSRVAGFRAAKNKGLSDADALGRVNKYLFDYSTKNWERPFKTAIPFWSFQKNLAKAGATMPFDRPLAAIAYNRLDRYQQQQFDQDFETVVPQLQELGYTEEEIEQFRTDQAKYFRGKLKIGDKYINTPFNAFSEKAMSQFGVNPWLGAAGEVADSTDSFGRPVKGSDSSLRSRILSKFPQFELGKQFKQKLDVDSGRSKPEQFYIGKPGSEGYGMGKSKQGYDPSRPNYVESLDPRRKLGQNLLAYAGVPRSMEFDKTKLVDTKRLQKVTQEYFNTDWKGMEYEDQQKAQEALFTKFGMSADDFYTGVLAKYDTANTTRIKGMKESARQQNQSLLAEYAKQPYGTRSAWAAKKMQELSESGYYGENPFLYSFIKGANGKSDKGWLTPESMAKTKLSTQKRADYQYAMKTGDWSKWRAKYGASSKSVAYEKAKSSGDWTEYRKKYGTKTTPYQTDGKFFKTAESMERYKEGAFWKQYAEADKTTRKKLLADNPQYNRRANWTDEQWDNWKKEKRESEIAKASGFKNFGSLLATFRSKNTIRAEQFAIKQNAGKKVV